LPREIDIKREVSKTKNKRNAFVKESVMRMAVAAERENVDADSYFYNAREYYFKSMEELKDSWQKHHSYISEEDFDKSLANTLKIAKMVEKIQVYSPIAYLPKIAEGEISAKDMFKKIIKEGAKIKLTPKIKDNPELKMKYEKRLKEELEIIFDLGFEDYFLIVWDFINWAKENNIMVGPGRGSVGGSLVAYCADITKVDPMEHGLLFSRFINKTRSSAKYKVDFDQFALEKK